MCYLSPTTDNELRRFAVLRADRCYFEFVWLLPLLPAAGVGACAGVEVPWFKLGLILALAPLGGVLDPTPVVWA